MPRVLSWAMRLVVMVTGLLVLAPAGSATLAQERELAERYAPVVRVVTQEKACGPGEPYDPIDVDDLFGQPTVAFRGPWQLDDLVKVGPEAIDLSPDRVEYHLDYPGNPLEPGCDYEEWADLITDDSEPTVYAHVAFDPDHPDQLALQYWLFYVFNDWNNLHEGDWEMIQLNFDAATVAEALEQEPTEVGYSQHEGAERAGWNDGKLERVEETHPVVYPAAGSHANYYGSAVYLGSSASTGVGCDDTSGDHTDLRPAVETIPSDPDAAVAAFPWIDFTGRWGERRPGFLNGPTGPNLKEQWSAPIAWSQEWRGEAYAVPAAGVFGTSATDFYCGAIAAGSGAARELLDNPGPTLVALIVIGLVGGWGLSRLTWRPTAPLRLGRRRAWGQIVTAAGRMYRRHALLFLGIGVLFIPIGLVGAGLTWMIVEATRVAGVPNEGEGSGLLVAIGVSAAVALVVAGVGLVQAATVRALIALDAGERISPLEAYRRVRHVRPLIGALALAAAAVVLLGLTIFLVPVALWLAGRWALLVPATELEGRRPVRSLRRSAELVRGHWWKVATLTVFSILIAGLLGPLIGALLILGASAPLPLVNIVAGIVLWAAMPFIALTSAYAYFDARATIELADPPAPDELPEEITTS